ncbi:DUF302 domain-containing protein [Aureimonas mangrovi]|uniref:DUF302 domain-containing protein n=1 Tax=Aureimonas mangrovi TaxID=2758041 RepID=UPI00163DA77B|nr:DUF302 domain-containing protein [Aureimonas mangrovi]
MPRSGLFFVALMALVAVFVASPHSHAADQWVVRQSAQSVEETVDRLEDAIRRSGSEVLAVFDQQAAARDVDFPMEATTVVLFAQPRTVSPLIAADRRAAIDMPQRILVWEEGGVTYAGYVDPMTLTTRYDIERNRPEIASLRSALDSLLEAAINRQEQRSAVSH